MEKPPLGFGVCFVSCLVLVLSVLVLSSRCAAIMIKLKKMIEWIKHIQCDAGKRVTDIQIGSQNLQGSLPKELAELTALEHFECQVNSLTGPFPYMPKSLQHLIISNNNFSSFPNDFFKGMTNLMEVRIDYNPFRQWQIPESLKDCVLLNTFSVMSAGLVGTITDFFGKDGPFPGLEYLALCFNLLEGGLPASFSGTSIKSILVNGQKSNSKLNGTLAVLRNLTSLLQIWAQGNSFTGPIPEFSNHDHLFDVSLRDNLLTGVVPPSLITLPSLQVVNLTNNYLQGSPPVFKGKVKVDNDMERDRNQFCTNKAGQPCSSLVNALLSAVEPLGYPLKLAESWQGNEPCANGWIGIVCSGGNISVINFQNTGLSGNISPSYASIKSVRRLLLANNDLTGTIPSELTSLPLLQELDVSNNHLYGRLPSFHQSMVVKSGGNPDIGKDNPAFMPGSDSGGNGKKRNTGAIVGIVVGVITLIGLGILLFIKFGRKCRHAGMQAKYKVQMQ